MWAFFFFFYWTILLKNVYVYNYKMYNNNQHMTWHYDTGLPSCSVHLLPLDGAENHNICPTECTGAVYTENSWENNEADVGRLSIYLSMDIMLLCSNLDHISEYRFNARCFKVIFSVVADD